VGTRNHVITAADRIDIDWLEEVLRKSGSLEHGGVQEFEVDEGRGNWSEIVKIRLRYRSASSGELPSNLLLKICKGSVMLQRIMQAVEDVGVDIFREM
jgi:hypothetical protein